MDNFFSSREMSRVLPSGLLNQRALTEALCSATQMFLGYSDKLDMFDKKIFVLTNSISHEAECKSCFNFDNCYDHAQRIGQMNIMLSIVAIELSMQSKDLWTCARTLEPCDTETSDKDVLFLLRNLPLAIYESQQTKKMPPKPTRPRQPPVKPATQPILHDNPRTIPNNYQPVSYQSSMVMPQKIYSRDLPTHTHYGSYNPHMKVQPMISSFPTIETLSVNLTMPPIGIISCDFIVTVNSVEDQEEIRHLQLIKNLTGFDEVTLNELQTIIELGYIKIKINAKESGETLEYALQSLFMSKKCLRVKLPRHTLYIRYNDGIEGCFVKNMLPQPSLQNNSSVQNFNRRSMSPVPKLINHGNQVEYHMNQGVPMRTSPSMDRYLTFIGEVMITNSMNRRMPYRQENIGMITGPNFQSRGSGMFVIE